MAIRVLICNWIRLYAEGLRRLLEEDEEIRVVAGRCGDKTEFQALLKSDPDLIFSDPACFTQISGRSSKIILLWDRRQPLPAFADLKEMVDHGLAGIVDARTEPAMLRKAVRKVFDGELWMGQGVIRSSLCTADNTRRDIQLSPRETEVLDHICEGYSNKEIAARLCISEQTVKTHCNHLFKKFGVTSRLQLALHASSGN